MAYLILGPSQPALEEIRTAARRHRGGVARIAVAWARDEGAWWLIEAVLKHDLTIDLIVGLNEKRTTVEALLRLLEISRSLTVFYKHPRQTFHPKFYLFHGGPARDDATLIVGSSNLTRGGLLTNFEASLVARVTADAVTPEDRRLLRDANNGWRSLSELQYAHRLQDVADVKRLYDAGHVVSEATVRAQRRNTARDASTDVGLPTSPPPYTRPDGYEQIRVPFPLDRDAAPEAPPLNIDLPGETPVPDRFFVRTLTVNDVRKLHGDRPGTFEPDLGQTARDRYPAFWGWPDQYETVVRKLPREEWQVEARLVSSATPLDGVLISVVLWFREERPGHAAEHRIGLQPIGRVREAAPGNFDTTSLLVVERAAEDANYTFLIRFVTKTDPTYEEFSSYLTEERPQHRFGYGP